MSSLPRVLAEVAKERGKQHQKWGEQDHVPDRWITIIGEEFGEVCDAINKCECDNALTPAESLIQYRAEMIQLAALAVAAIECLDRQMMKQDMEDVDA